jgi:hypothetical protein
MSWKRGDTGSDVVKDCEHSSPPNRLLKGYGRFEGRRKS